MARAACSGGSGERTGQVHAIGHFGVHEAGFDRGDLYIGAVQTVAKAL